MNRTMLDLWVGLFVVAGIAALLFLALKVGSMNTVNNADSYEVTARFENIGGLKTRAPVKSAGVVAIKHSKRSARTDSPVRDTQQLD